MTFWYWFYHSFAGWLLRIQLVLLRSFSFFVVRIIYIITRRGIRKIIEPSSKKMLSEEEERQRLAGCRSVVLAFANTFGTIARECITRAELEKLIDNGISPQDLSATIHSRMRESPGLMLGEVPAGESLIPGIRLRRDS